MAVAPALLLAACATTRAPSPFQSWQSRQRELLALTRWSADGQLAIRSRGHGGQASWRWERKGSFQRLTVSGPFGRTLFIVREEGRRVALIDGRGRRFSAQNATDLIRKVTGWRVPADDLSYWILGTPRPGVPDRHSTDRSGRLTMLWQSGWTVRFSRYDRYHAIDLPRDLTAVYRRPGSPSVHLHMTVHRWRIP
ncbi:MAG: lipoprotein insertase outer membrane protein LolB [Acidiferrobacteraceae bacterium]